MPKTNHKETIEALEKVMANSDATTVKDIKEYLGALIKPHPNLCLAVNILDIEGGDAIAKTWNMQGPFIRWQEKSKGMKDKKEKMKESTKLAFCYAGFIQHNVNLLQMSIKLYMTFFPFVDSSRAKEILTNTQIMNGCELFTDGGVNKTVEELSHDELFSDLNPPSKERYELVSYYRSILTSLSKIFD